MLRWVIPYSYLRNRMSDRQAVFFAEYHLDVKVVWHGYHIASVPLMARGACQTCVLWTTPKTLYINNRTTAEPIGLRLCVARHSTDNSCLWVIFGVLQHVHTPLLYLENGWTDCAEIWHVASGQLVMWLPHVYGGVNMHVRTCTPHFYISGTAEPIALTFGM